MDVVLISLKRPNQGDRTKQYTEQDKFEERQYGFGYRYRQWNNNKYRIICIKRV